MSTERKPNRRPTGRYLDPEPKQHTPKEQTIVDAIIRFLKKLPKCKAEKTHGGMYGRAGKPDITGCLDGRRFEIEVKRPGNKPTEIQLKHLREWKEAGALTGVAYNVDDVIRILELKPEEVDHLLRRRG